MAGHPGTAPYSKMIVAAAAGGEPGPAVESVGTEEQRREQPEPGLVVVGGGQH